MADIRGGRSMAAGLCLLLGAQSVSAGKIDEFRKAGKKTHSTPAPSSDTASVSSYDSAASASSYSSSGSGSSSGGSWDFLGGFVGWLITAPFSHHQDDSSTSGLSASDDPAEMEGWADERSGILPPRKLGDMAMPYVRADLNWQYIDSNFEARDFRLEAGYKMVAFHGRHTKYIEGNPDDELDINQFYGVLRYGGRVDDMFPGLSCEIGLGLGVVQQKDVFEEHSSGAITIPLKVYLSDWLGAEFRPAWYRPEDLVVSDYDLSASLGWRYVQGRIGYRWLWMQSVGHFFNGPYAGVSVSF